MESGGIIFWHLDAHDVFDSRRFARFTVGMRFTKENLHKITCPECGTLLFQYHVSDCGGKVHYYFPAWGAVIVRGDPTEFAYDALCARCGDMRRCVAVVELWPDACIGKPFTSLPETRTSFPDRRLHSIVGSTFRQLQKEHVSAGPCECARACMAAFEENMTRVRAIGDVPLRAAGYTKLLGSINGEQQRMLGEIARNECPDWDCDAGKRIRALHRQKWELLEGPLDKLLHTKILSDGSMELQNWALTFEDINTGVKMILAAQITLAWTAFEVLATDLWVAALNDMPNPLASKFAATKQEKGQEKSLTIAKMASYGNRDFDLSKLMGNILRDNKADFTSLRSTQFAYEKAFDCKVSAFDSDDLKLLELLRNLILHNAGIVDEKFIEDTEKRGLKQHRFCTSIQEKQPFPIDYRVAWGLIQNAVKCGLSLIDFVSTQMNLQHSPTLQ